MASRSDSNHLNGDEHAPFLQTETDQQSFEKQNEVSNSEDSCKFQSELVGESSGENSVENEFQKSASSSSSSSCLGAVYSEDSCKTEFQNEFVGESSGENSAENEFHKSALSSSSSCPGSVCHNSQQSTASGVETREIREERNEEVVRQGNIARRLTEVLQGDGDADLLLQQTGRENGMLQWLQALDLQVMGACRADERLRPMLQLNVSCSGADDKLLAQLSQHFKARELGMLARCLCVPLVSIRVGKILKQGRTLCPTSTRGHLSLTLLPSSDLRLSFVGDDGTMERLATLCPENENVSVSIEEIGSDATGRSFLLRLPSGKLSFYWQSEKSKLVGDEFLSKMKDLLGQRPSLAQLTGIRESRLDSFATYLRATFLGSSNSSSKQGSSSSTNDIARSGTSETSANAISSSMSAHSVRPSHRFKVASSLPIVHGKFHVGSQGSLSPRGSTFKDGQLRNTTGIRNVSSARDKMKRRMDANHNVLSIIGNDGSILEQMPANIENCSNNASFPLNSQVSDSSTCTDGSDQAVFQSSGVIKPEHVHAPSSMGESLPTLPSYFMVESSFNPLAVSLPTTRFPIGGSPIFSPYYCPCPLRTSTLQYTVTPTFLPSVSTESVSLPPPASSLLSVGSSASLVPPMPLDLHNGSFSPISLPVPSLVNMPTPLQSSSLPSFLSDPVLNVPLPVSSFVTVPTPQQISNFTPFFSDPIIHIPVLDFHSSGQGYIVSAGPSISSAISPMLPGLLSTLIPESNNVSGKEDAHTMQLLAGLEFAFPWRGSEANASSVASLSPVSIHGSRPSTDLRNDASLQSNSTNVDLCFMTPQHKGQIIDTIPSLFSTSPFPHLYRIDQDVRSNLSGLVTGSRGLYCGQCDPIVATNMFTGARQRSEVRSDADMDVHSRNQPVFLPEFGSFSRSNATSKDVESQMDAMNEKSDS